MNTPISINAPINVPFRGNNLYLVEHQGNPYVPMKPVVEGMGLDWKTQHRKMTAKFNSCMVEMTTQLPGDTQNRAVTCLPLRKLPAWLYSVQPGKVSPEIREKVVAYQEECDEVLWQYWTKGKVDRQSVAEEQRKLPSTYIEALKEQLGVGTKHKSVKGAGWSSSISMRVATAARPPIGSRRLRWRWDWLATSSTLKTLTTAQ